MKENIICTVCPVGCMVEVVGNKEEKKVDSLTGNKCPRGEKHATNEFIAPIRTITTTIKVSNGNEVLVPVRTDDGVLRDMQFACMDVIRDTVVEAPVKRGDILIENILGTGVNVVATGNVNKM
jgi:CxxC motif-containing protein